MGFLAECVALLFGQKETITTKKKAPHPTVKVHRLEVPKRGTIPELVDAIRALQSQVK